MKVSTNSMIEKLSDEHRSMIKDVAFLMYKGYSQEAIAKQLGLTESKAQYLSCVVMGSHRVDEFEVTKRMTILEMEKIEIELFALIGMYNTGEVMSYGELSRMKHLASVYAYGEC